MFQVFDGQPNQFIREYREANPTLTKPVGTTPTPPTHGNGNANSLQGVNTIRLLVTFRPDVVPDAVQRPELQKKLQEEATRKLVQGGIPVPRYGEEPGRPLLYVLITLGNRSGVGIRSIVVESEFWQNVRPIRDLSKQTYAVTWESGTSDSGPITDDAVRQVVNKQLDEFIKAYGNGEFNSSRAGREKSLTLRVRSADRISK